MGSSVVSRLPGFGFLIIGGLRDGEAESFSPEYFSVTFSEVIEKKEDTLEYLSIQRDRASLFVLVAEEVSGFRVSALIGELVLAKRYSFKNGDFIRSVPLGIFVIR